MKLLTVVVSYNRLELLKLTLDSYRRTVSGPHRLVVVDNCSDDETRRWLVAANQPCVFLGENRYPGYATNLGWDLLLRGLRADHLLHRSDNDVEYLPGWSQQVRRRFAAEPALGQLGLRTVAEEGAQSAVGGNCVIRSGLFREGYRYSELPWPDNPHEDASLVHSGFLSVNGWSWDRVAEPCIVHRGMASRDDPYYQQTFRDRGLSFNTFGL